MLFNETSEKGKFQGKVYQVVKGEWCWRWWKI